MTDAADKPVTDWEAIARALRIGFPSIRELARQHGVSDTAIRKFKKKHGIEPDLTQQVETKVRNELVRTEVRTQTPGSRVSDKDVVEAAAAQQVQVVREHRTDIRTGKELVTLLMAQMKDTIGARTAIETFIEIETKSDDDNGKRYNALMKAVAIPTHTTALGNLANALKTFIGLERQAFNIGDEPPQQQDALTALIDRVQTSGSRLPIRNPNQKTDVEKE